nr:AAA family ATPase [Actinomycetales bacterium]
MYSAADPVDWAPRRVLVTGVTGSGKSTLVQRIGDRLGVPSTEMDALHWGAGWQERPEFRAEAAALAARPAWVTELQYTSKLGALFLERADTLVWLDLPPRVSLTRLTVRTVRRRRRRERLWGVNVEPPLWTIATDRDHIIRWWWRTRKNAAKRVPAYAVAHPRLRVVQLGSRREVDAWLEGLEGAGTVGAGPSPDK